jgi:hypothetical protein
MWCKEGPLSIWWLLVVVVVVMLPSLPWLEAVVALEEF